MGGKFETEVDSIYLGGGTPTVLEDGQLRSMFHAVRAHFSVMTSAEVTVECAPGTLSATVLQTLISCGVNRVSLGVQSFIDQEAAAVGRLHKRSKVLDDIAHLRDAAKDEIGFRADRRTGDGFSVGEGVFGLEDGEFSGQRDAGGLGGGLR